MTIFVQPYSDSNLMHSLASANENFIKQPNDSKYASMGNAIHELNLFKLNLFHKGARN